MTKWEITQYGVRLMECISKDIGLRLIRSEPTFRLHSYGMHRPEEVVAYTHDEIMRGSQPQDEYHTAMARNNANYKDNRN